MWRWSSFPIYPFLWNCVFSTYVEVIPKSSKRYECIYCILHVCGGDPKILLIANLSFQYSPRMWRWSPWCGFFNPYTNSILHVCGGDPTKQQLWHHYLKVFSTYVEVIHVRHDLEFQLLRYSPRMWRWSLGFREAMRVLKVFSTYVEVILILPLKLLIQISILHVCGGDPARAEFYTNFNKYSPRMWRWSQ